MNELCSICFFHESLLWFPVNRNEFFVVLEESVWFIQLNGFDTLSVLTVYFMNQLLWFPVNRNEVRVFVVLKEPVWLTHEWALPVLSVFFMNHCCGFQLMVEICSSKGIRVIHAVKPLWYLQLLKLVEWNCFHVKCSIQRQLTNIYFPVNNLIEVFLNEVPWIQQIQWIVTKSKGGMVNKRITHLATDKLLVLQ